MVQMPDGQRYYVNQPGLDKNDVFRFGAQIAPYLPGSQLASAIPKLGMRMLGQGAVAGATNAAGQSLVRDNIDAGEVITTAALGAGAETLGPVARKAVINPVRKLLGLGASPGTAGRQFAKSMGFPDNLPKSKYVEIENRLAAGEDPKAVMGELRFGFQYTKGQKTGNQQELIKEEPLYQTSPAIMNVVKQNDEAAQRGITGFTQKFSGDAPPQTPVEGMQRVQSKIQEQAKMLKGEVRTAYESAGTKAAIDAKSLGGLGKQISNDLRAGNVAIHPSGTPKTYEAMQLIETEINKLNKSNAVTIKVNAAERMRGWINGKLGEAKQGGNPTDARAAVALKKSYDNWFNQVMDDALVSGDKAAIDSLKRGRNLRAAYGERFEGRGADKQIDNFIESMVSGDKAPDELINAALGMSQVSKSSAYKFVERLKVASKNDPQVISDMKSAHIMQLLTDKAGKPLPFGSIVRNIASTERNSPELIKSLYGQEWKQVKAFASAIEPLLAKGDMAKSSGTAERVLRYLSAFKIAPFMERPIAVLKDIGASRAGAKALEPLKPKPVPLPQTPRALVAGAAAYGNN